MRRLSIRLAIVSIAVLLSTALLHAEMVKRDYNRRPTKCSYLFKVYLAFEEANSLFDL